MLKMRRRAAGEGVKTDAIRREARGVEGRETVRASKVDEAFHCGLKALDTAFESLHPPASKHQLSAAQPPRYPLTLRRTTSPGESRTRKVFQ